MNISFDAKIHGDAEEEWTWAAWVSTREYYKELIGCGLECVSLMCDYFDSLRDGLGTTLCFQV